MSGNCRVMVLRVSALNYNTYSHEMAAVGCRVTTAVAIVTEDVFGNVVAPPSKVMTIARLAPPLSGASAFRRAWRTSWSVPAPAPDRAASGRHAVHLTPDSPAELHTSY